MRGQRVETVGQCVETAPRSRVIRSLHGRPAMYICFCRPPPTTARPSQSMKLQVLTSTVAVAAIWNMAMAQVLPRFKIGALFSLSGSHAAADREALFGVRYWYVAFILYEYL